VKRPVKIGLWLLGFAVLGLLGLWLEHERAKARLAAFKADLIAKGEKLAIADHVPKFPPAFSNAAPDFLAAANRLTELKAEFQPLRMRMIAPGKARVTWQQAELPTEKDMDIWPIVTAHVEDSRHLLTEMAIALERPEMVFNLDYAKGFSLLLPHLAKVRQAANNFGMAAIVDLHLGQTNSAFTNLLAGVRIAQRLQEPLMISQLVRVAGGQLSVAATWEALHASAWSDGQLAQLQNGWQIVQMMDGWIAEANMERALGQWGFAEARGRPAMLDELGGLGSSSGPTPGFLELLVNDPLKAAGMVVPPARALSWQLWFSYADERWALENYQVWIDAARRARAADAFESAQARMAAELNRRGDPALTMLLSRMLLPALGKVHARFATFETVRRLTFTAIALHRHRLKHGQFPASLGALVPEFLAEVPRDFMDGQPLRYKLQPDGQFLLWSVGEDFKDDGGDATTVGAQSTNPFDWLRGRDWVWPQAATEAEVAAHHAELAAKRALLTPKPSP